MIKNAAPPELAGAAFGTGSSIGLIGMAVGPIWGGSLFAYSSSPDAGLGILGQGRLFFIVLSSLALANASLAFTLPRGQSLKGRVGDLSRRRLVAAIVECRRFVASAMRRRRGPDTLFGATETTPSPRPWPADGGTYSYRAKKRLLQRLPSAGSGVY